MNGATSKKLKKVAELVYIKTIAPLRRQILDERLPADELMVKLSELRTPRQVYRMIKREYKRRARG